MDKPELKVSVFSDYICPFCYVGSRRLLRLQEMYELKVNWCGLEIHPDTPAAGMPLTGLDYGEAKWSQMMTALHAMAEEEGLVLAETGFTTNSHQALLLAEAAKQAGRDIFYALHERLFQAYFSEGRNIGDESVLRELAAECEVPLDLTEAAWADEQYAKRLQLNLLYAVELKLQGTPSYVFGEQRLSGAVPYADLRAAAQRLVAG